MEELVESIEGLRGMTALRSGRMAEEGFEEDAMAGGIVGESGGVEEGTCTGAGRGARGDWPEEEARSCLVASCLNASLVTALRSSS